MATNSLVELILKLLNDPQALAEFREHPDAALAACGASDVSPADIHDALVLADDQEGDFSREHHSGAHLPPPAHPHPHPGETEHEAAVRYINEYVTNNYVDDRDTTVDNSVNQQIDTGGGDFDQTIHNTNTTASGDGAVAAGGDIDGSTVTTGNDNQVGDGNIKGDGNIQGEGNQVVQGDHNTTAFGTGAANSADIDHVSVSGGGALSVGGNASGDQHNTDSHNTTETTDTTKVDIDHSFNTHEEATIDSHNSDESHTSTDSHNVDHEDLLSHNSLTDVHPA